VRPQWQFYAWIVVLLLIGCALVLLKPLPVY
jgi:hypothetical protein